MNGSIESERAAREGMKVKGGWPRASREAGTGDSQTASGLPTRGFQGLTWVAVTSQSTGLILGLNQRHPSAGDPTATAASAY